MPSTTTLLDPTGEHQVTHRKKAPKPVSLEGRTVGLLDIGKPRGDVFLNRLDERLTERGITSDQQLVRVSLIVDPERRYAPAPHDNTRAEARDWPIKLPVCETFDAARDLGLEICCGCWIPVV